MVTKSKQSDAADDGKPTAPSATVADTSAAAAAAESAGIVGAGATASGLASDNLGEKTVVKEATSDTLSGPLADLSDSQEAFLEQDANKEFSEDPAGTGSMAVVTKVPANASADYPGRDKALAATDGGRNMPGNLDAILRARFAGTPVPGDAQLMSAEEIDALKAEFVDNIEPKTVTGEGTRFVGSDPNLIQHGEDEINPNTPTNERVAKD